MSASTRSRPASPGPPAQRQREVAPVAEIRPQPHKAFGKRGVRGIRQKDGQQSLTMPGEVLPAKVAGPFSRSPLADREQAAEPCIGGAIGRVDEDGQAVAQIEPTSHDQSDASLLGALMCPSNAGEGIAVGDAECRQTKQPGLRHQLLDMRRAAQERVVRGNL